MWPDKPLDYVKLNDDLEGIHFGLFLNDKLVSVVSLFIKNEIAQFRKLATESEFQRKGLATELINCVFHYCQQRQVSKIWCNARQEKVDFYNKFQMTSTDNRFRKGGIDYVVMECIFN